MGRAKQLLPLGGRTMLEHAVHVALDSACRPIVVVLGASAEQCKAPLAGLDVEIAINGEWENGIGTSIRRGVAHMLGRAIVPRSAVLMLADQPAISSEILRGLIAAHAAGTQSVTICADGDIIGPPVVFDREHFGSLLLLRDGEGAKSLWLKNPEIVQRRLVSECRTDIDTPMDYKNYAGATLPEKIMPGGTGSA